jgi:UDP-N-acetylglucosamine diphosphorylase / glucose-1-phosphate thymidylyltransferase / UDP-N-acetylgalactosamine diphosphorylase / glucosamine-1-phosphate N-acetyltransferase / galactosamine-1-phosphate N-acetyltransferase
MAKIGLVPAAGAGVRAYPATNYIPKVMLEIAGKPIILRNIEIMRDKLDIKDIYVITGYKGDVIKRYLRDGANFGVRIKYIDCPEHTVGLARGMLLAKGIIKEDFVTILGDEVYIDSDHEKMRNMDLRGYGAACGLMNTDDFNIIAKNYTVKMDGERIRMLIEKPDEIESSILGCGTYLFTPDIFDAIENTKPNRRSGRVELTDAIGYLATGARGVRGVFLKGIYQNINSVEDYNYANYVYRSTFFKDYRVSVVIPAYNEEESITSVVKDFADKVDEVLVVDNSSKDNTRDAALKAGARVETVSLKGYGDTIRWGLDNARGDILIIAEADHSFRAKDLGKFLEYMKDSDMVIGTRTTRQMIEQGANMKGLLRWGNVAVGKLVEALWWGQEPRFTDVGCTYRAIWKDTYLKIRDNLEGIGPEFSPEMMIEVLRARKRIIEIPISYYKRLTGISKHSQNYFKVSGTALRMLKMIFKKRF